MCVFSLGSGCSGLIAGDVVVVAESWVDCGCCCHCGKTCRWINHGPVRTNLSPRIYFPYSRPTDDILCAKTETAGLRP